MLDATRAKNAFKAKMQTRFGPNPDPNYDFTFQALFDAIVDELTSNAELKTAHLNSNTVTISGPSSGTVDDSSVVGGIK